MAKIVVDCEYINDKPDYEFSVGFHKKLKEFMPNDKKVIKRLPKVGKTKADVLNIEFEGYLEGKPDSDIFLEQSLEFGKFLKEATDFISSVGPIRAKEDALYG